MLYSSHGSKSSAHHIKVSRNQRIHLLTLSNRQGISTSQIAYLGPFAKSPDIVAKVWYYAHLSPKIHAQDQTMRKIRQDQYGQYTGTSHQVERSGYRSQRRAGISISHSTRTSLGRIQRKSQRQQQLISSSSNHCVRSTGVKKSQYVSTKHRYIQVRSIIS